MLVTWPPMPQWLPRGTSRTGYFWEGLVRFAWPDVAESLDFDSEAGTFRANGNLPSVPACRGVQWWAAIPNAPSGPTMNP
jgi:hypothetical protein